MFYRYSDRTAARRPLRYATGAEVRRSIIVDYNTIPADSAGRRLIQPGKLLVKITASGKYGPYDATASDGRQTITAPTAGVISAAIAAESADVRLGDRAIAGYVHNCVFDLSELTLDGAQLAALKNAFPTCTFDD